MGNNSIYGNWDIAFRVTNIIFLAPSFSLSTLSNYATYTLQRWDIQEIQN